MMISSIKQNENGQERSPVVNRVLRLQQFGLQVSDGNLLLLQRGQVLLWVRRSNAMIVPTRVVVAQVGSSVYQTKKNKNQLYPFKKPASFISPPAWGCRGNLMCRSKNDLCQQ